MCIISTSHLPPPPLIYGIASVRIALVIGKCTLLGVISWDKARVGFILKFKYHKSSNSKQMQTFIQKVRGRVEVRILKPGVGFFMETRVNQGKRV